MFIIVIFPDISNIFMNSSDGDGFSKDQEQNIQVKTRMDFFPHLCISQRNVHNILQSI